MTSSAVPKIVLLWVAGLLPPAAASSPPSDPARQEIELLRREIRELRLALNLFRVEALGRAIVAAEAEVLRVRERLRKLEIEERQIREDVTRMEVKAVNTPPGEAREEDSDVAASRELKPGSALYRVLAEAEAIRRRESELSRLIDHDRQRWQASLEAANGIQAELNRVRTSIPGR